MVYESEKNPGYFRKLKRTYRVTRSICFMIIFFNNSSWVNSIELIHSPRGVFRKRREPIFCF